MTEDEEQRAKALQLRWAPLVLAVVMAGFGLQQASPYVDPILLFTAPLLYGMVYALIYQTAVHREKALWRLWAMTSSFVGAIVATGAILYCLFASLLELRQPCERYRRMLMERPNSEVSDAYQALQCPMSIDALMKK